MSRVDRIVEINAGENCENVGLEEGDQQFESHQRHRHSKRDDCAEPSKNTHCAQHGDEGTKHIERDMTGKDIGDKRTLCESGRDKNESTSVEVTNGRI